MGTKVSEWRTQVYFPEKLHRRVKAMAQEQGISIAEVIRRAVEHYLEGEYPEETDWQDDPLLKIVGAAEGVGVRDASLQHDRYIYGYPLKRRDGKAEDKDKSGEGRDDTD